MLEKDEKNMAVDKKVAGWKDKAHEITVMEEFKIDVIEENVVKVIQDDAKRVVDKPLEEESLIPTSILEEFHGVIMKKESVIEEKKRRI
jgi:hypothetical protein